MNMSPKTVGWALFFLLAVYYLLNRYPGLAFIDSGELALCSYSFGVPHPTGYPLYLILTAPVTKLFLRPITAVTLFSGIIMACTGVAVYWLFRRLWPLCFPDDDLSPVAAAAVSLLLCLSPVVAAQGTTNEVYGLGLLTGSILLALLMSIMIDASRRRSTQFLIAAWYVWGLSLCNHMSAVQFFPALAMVTGYHLKRAFVWSTVFAIVPAVFIPLTMYTVLPIRAGAEPPPASNWGMVDSWGNFFRHVSGWQFNIWLFTGNVEEIWLNARHLVSMIADQFPWPVLMSAPIGVYAAWRRSPLLVAILGSTAAVNIVLGINYSIPDIDSYYLQTIATIGICAGIGVFSIGRWFRSRRVGGIILAVFLVWQTISVWRINYRSDYTLPEDYAYNICRSAPYGAVILSDIWDHHGQLYYLQQAEQVRPDLRLIDKQLLRRSWYYDMIRQAYPELYAHIDSLAAEFMSEVRLFESGADFDPRTLEFYYQSIINRLLTRCGPAYIDYRLDYRPIGNHYLRPSGLLFKVDTVRISQNLEQPRLLWRGRDLIDYADWRALEHIHMIHEMSRRR